MSLQINVSQEDQRFAEQYRAREIEAEKLARGEGFTVNKHSGKYSGTVNGGGVEEHKVYQMSAEDFKTDGIVGSLGMHRAHDGAVVQVGGMTMTLGMAVQLGLVNKDAQGNYHDNGDAIKKMSQPQATAKATHKPKTWDFENPLLIL